jgi:hypothetical protein
MEIKDLFIGFLSKTLNIDENGVASLFNEDGSVKEDAEATVLGWHAESVKGLKGSSTKQAFDDGYKKAQSEVLSSFEKTFKEKTGFKSDKKGIDLILDYTASAGKGDINEDAVKKHPLYLQMLEDKEKQLSEAIQSGESNLNTYKAGIEKEKLFSSVSQKGLEYFYSFKPVLSTDSLKAKRQEEIFLNQLKGFEFEQQGERTVVLKDGKLYEDAHGKAYTLDRLSKEITNTYFDTHDVEPKVSPNSGKQNGVQSKKFNFEIPKNQMEFIKVMNDANIPLEEKNAISAAYDSNQKVNQ